MTFGTPEWSFHKIEAAGYLLDRGVLRNQRIESRIEAFKAPLISLLVRLVERQD